MHSISSRWRKPKKRPSKRSKAGAENSKKRCLSSSTAECSSFSVVNDDFIDNESSISMNCTLMDDNSWSALLSKVPCSECNSLNSLRISVLQSYGFAKNLELLCSDCGHSFGKSFTSAREEHSRKFKINEKVVSSFLSIGKGHAALETFSMILGMPGMDRKTFSKCLDSLAEKNVHVKEEVLKVSRDIVRKAYFDALSLQHNSESILDITVSYDGTWQKRGHTSLYGIGTVIDVVTGLVLDFEILSKYCHECVTAEKDLNKHSAEFACWLEGHKTQCQKNFDGSSNSMEMCAAFTIWKRSIQKNGMRYSTMLSDGDAKTHQYLNEQKVYGKDTPILKEECINHCAKRLGTALRNKIKECRAKGITISGRKNGNLKEETIMKLQNYYRKAIKDNAPDIDKMKTSIFATLYHAMSTDNKPNHSKCPVGESSWCFYQRAAACNIKPASHSSMKTHLSEVVVSKILPVYQRLASDELLQRCISGKTQNANETFHSCIWAKCPKEVSVSKKRLELAVTSAVSEFNLGCIKSLELFSQKNEISIHSQRIAERRDARRSKQKNRRSGETYVKPSVQRKIKKLALNAKKEKKEGVTYGAGQF